MESRLVGERVGSFGLSRGSVLNHLNRKLPLCDRPPPTLFFVCGSPLLASLRARRLASGVHRMWRMMVGAFLRVIVFRNLGDRYDLPLKKLPQGREAINRNQGHMQFRTTMMQKATERLGLPCE